LRAWQSEAIDRYFAAGRRDFLAVATPGAGKTTFALQVAGRLLRSHRIDRIVVVTPTDHLKTQWAQAAARAGIPLDPAYSGRTGKVGTDYRGFALTYAGVASNPTGYRVRVERSKTLVVLDEVHHAGDALAWGEAVREAFEPAARRLALTGTPFRSDTNPIPFVTYAPGDDGISRSEADYIYGYTEALRDGVVRPVLFMAYSGAMRWRTGAGDEVEARLGEPLTKDLHAQALRTALDPSGAWIPGVLTAADTRLSEVRRHVPDAGGLVIAGDQTSARAYAGVLEDVTGVKPTVVLSDETQSSNRIQEFSQSDDRWMVAVRMVSEGVDIPRLAVGVYATPTATPLFFAQAVGRFVRARRRGETATVFVPSVPGLLAMASTLEVERDHALGRAVEYDADIFAAEEDLLRSARAEQGEAPEQLPWQALDSDASFDRIVYDGGEYGGEAQVSAGSAEEMDYLGIPGLLDPDQVRELLRRRQAQQTRRRPTVAAGTDVQPPAAVHERLAVLRRELNGLVGAWYHRTGSPHGVTHASLRSACGGPPAAQASAEQLTARIELLRQWARRPSA
jgi:superfamily II DNA or RNA helicase